MIVRQILAVVAVVRLPQVVMALLVAPEEMEPHPLFRGQAHLMRVVAGVELLVQMAEPQEVVAVE